ncbi:unnamed protein product [Pedinophyceae sp. YPF-701]|nr:unnamed protein product [Pedinophyceae sp. YPF-701]
MTDYWKSNAMHWCEYCKVWLQDNVVAIQRHEQGMKHKLAVQKRLADMKVRASQEKKEQELAKTSMAQIEEAARKAYERDIAAGVIEGEKVATYKEPVGPSLPSPADDTAGGGKDMRGWYFDDASGYYYHDKAAYYFHKDTGMYYGGDPQEWVERLPPEKLAYSFPRDDDDGLPRNAQIASREDVQHKVTVRRAPETKLVRTQVGGHYIPSTGTYGASKGVFSKNAGGVKRRRDEGNGGKQAEKKAVSKEEAEALAKREAARKRVDARTKAFYGLG